MIDLLGRYYLGYDLYFKNILFQSKFIHQFLHGHPMGAVCDEKSAKILIIRCSTRSETYRSFFLTSNRDKATKYHVTRLLKLFSTSGHLSL